MNFDEFYMLKAIEAGEKARLRSPPNPWVGCVIVKNNEIVGDGFTQAVGGAHAEVEALLKAGDKAKDSTVYVTLEPCSHYGRTPPCSLALIKAKVKRVVIGLQDPDIKVSGEGLKLLQSAGIAVDVGVCAKEAHQLLEPYLYQRRSGLPFCLCKAAVSLDGRIAAADQSSRWISSQDSRAYSHYLRSISQAILIGSHTANFDQPCLNVRHSPSPLSPPLRVIIDSTGKTRVQGSLFDLSIAPTLIYTTNLCPKDLRLKWEKTGVEVIELEAQEKHVPLKSVLSDLSQRGVLQVLVEGGAGIFSSFLKNKLCQKLTLIHGPRILGTNGLSLFSHFYVPTIAQAPIVELQECFRLGNDVITSYRFKEKVLDVY